VEPGGTGRLHPVHLVPPALGPRRPGAAFDDDLAAAIGPFAAADGTFPHDVGFVYDLARKPTD
jgi:hypothetical protein